VGEVQAREHTVNKKTILVVDDDPVILACTYRLLQKGGHNVLRARDGPEALRLSQNHPGDIDLLLTDFQMPGMSGIDLATEVTLGRPAIKVLMMSGFTGGMLVLNEGWHFLAKPFVSSQLRALVTGLLFPEKSRFRK
jgi:two-component system cell cycle sensor histidine kinase/response regulator CckA